MFHKVISDIKQFGKKVKKVLNGILGKVHDELKYCRDNVFFSFCCLSNFVESLKSFCFVFFL